MEHKEWVKVNKAITNTKPHALYSGTEKKAIAVCTKTSQLVEIAKEMGRSPRALASLWYDLKNRGW